MSMRENNLNLIKKLHYIWNTGNLDIIPDVYSNNFVVHWPKGWGSDTKGHDGISRSIKETREIFENWHEEVLDIIVDDFKVVTRYKSSGIHSQSYLGYNASGKKIEFEEISIYRIENNKVAEQWCLGDDLHMIKQLQSER